MTEATEAQAVRLSDRLRYRAVADEGVLVHLERGQVLVVNEVGLHLVEALARQPMTVADLSESVVRAFEVEPDQARADVETFLVQLRAEDAVESAEAPGAGPA